MAAFPPLRTVDVVPVEHEGEQYVCLVDPDGYAPDQVVLSQAAAVVASLLDGSNGAAEIQHAFAELFSGQRVQASKIEEVVDYLSEAGFLEDERFLAIHQAAHDAWDARKSRPATLAGKSYPADAAELRRHIDGFFEGIGEGRPPEPDVSTEAAPLRCLIAPHIDYGRGATAYAHAYGKLASRPKPDTVFIFGVAHAGACEAFTLTRKGFETPFGTLEVDKEAVEKLAASCDWDPFADEYVHLNEHSIELQAVMVAYLYGPSVRIVPILCASICGDDGRVKAPEHESVLPFLDTCREMAADPQRRVTVIAGADLAHVGRRFGDDFDISDAVIGIVEERDRADLAHVLKGSYKGWFDGVMHDGNRRRVCGLNCIYAALRTSGASMGELHHYGYAPDPAGGIVSFASIHLE